MIDRKSRLFPRIINQALIFMQTHDVRGKHALFRKLRHGANRKLIEYQLNHRPFLIPVDEWCFWLEFGPGNYYLDELLPFCEAINALDSEFTFFDLGADIGVVSSLVESHCPKLGQIIAVEPNPSSFELLDENLAHFSCTTLNLNAAVSDFSGTCAFTAAAHRTIDHEGRINPQESGNTQVFSVDRIVRQFKLELSDNLVFKIDVEGQESQVIKGGREIISAAKKVLVLLEIHPDVLQENQETPEKLLDEIEQIRPIQWMVPKHGNQIVNRSRKFFDQFETHQYDIIGISV